MRQWMLSSAIGIGVVGLLPVLPSFVELSSLLLLSMLLALYSRQLMPVIGFVLGVGWATLYGQHLIRGQIPDDWQGIDLRVSGQVVGLPVSYHRNGQDLQQFDFQLDGPLCTKNDLLLESGSCIGRINRLRLKWYRFDSVEPGQRWQITVRLKRPMGFANPGGFDYQTWLITRGYGATGYVRDADESVVLGVDKLRVDRARSLIVSKIDQYGSGLSNKNILKALLVGDKSEIGSVQWDLFARTGISHLMVISGLHVGLLSSLGFVLGRRVAQLTMRTHADRWGACLAIFLAIMYAAAAGFSLATQRALIMVLVWMSALMGYRHIAASEALIIALLLCLLIDPLAPFSLSFWLSFSAVAFIFYGSVGRRQNKQRWQKSWLSQYFVFIGLMPVLASLLGQVSLFSPLANLVLIPIFSLAVVPVNLLAGLLLGVNPDLSTWLWQYLDILIGYCLSYIQWLDGVAAHGVLYMPHLPIVVQLLAIVAAVIALLPKGIPLRWMAVVLMMPLFVYRPAAISVGDLRVTVIDVGQGLSVLIETHQHHLLFDTGPSYGEGFSAASSAVIPLLRYLDITSLDRLILSHGDNDHVGGYEHISKAITIKSIAYGEKLKNISGIGEPCRYGQSWSWDGISFDFLYPQVNENIRSLSGNNHSCVLKVSSGDIDFLLPGDIEAKVERELIALMPNELEAEVLIAPHHGSATSSTLGFVNAVAARHVVFSSGFRNQFNHPRPDVVNRYLTSGAQLHYSAGAGAITFEVVGGKLQNVTHYRDSLLGYWR
jgi:competence protein ComEC